MRIAKANLNVLQRVLWFGAGVFALVFLGYWFFLRNRPERLMQFGPADQALFSGGFTVQNGLLIWSPSENAILAQPVQGGKQREIAHVAPPYILRDIYRGFAFTNGTLIYETIPKPKPSFAGTGGSSQPSSMRYLGTFATPLRKPPPQELAREKRVVNKRDSFDPGKDMSQFWRVSLNGSTPEKLSFRAPGLRYGEATYWLDSHIGDDSVSISRGNEAWSEVIGHSALMSTSLYDGATHRICSGLTAQTPLMPGNSGIFWSELHAFPDKGLDLCYYRPADNRQYRLTNYPVRYGSLDAPVEYQGRLYWFTYALYNAAQRTQINETDYYASNSLIVSALVSANLDGSEQQKIVSLHWPGRVPADKLTVYQGKLYCILREAKDRDNDSEVNQWPRIFLACIRPGKQRPMDSVMELSRNANFFHFDQGYLYFSVQEEQQNWLAKLSDDHTSAKMTCSLFRVRLPR